MSMRRTEAHGGVRPASQYIPKLKVGFGDPLLVNGATTVTPTAYGLRSTTGTTGGGSRSDWSGWTAEDISVGGERAWEESGGESGRGGRGTRIAV